MPSASEHGNRSECKGKTEQQLLYQRGSKRAQFVKYNHGMEKYRQEKECTDKAISISIEHHVCTTLVPPLQCIKRLYTVQHSSCFTTALLFASALLSVLSICASQPIFSLPTSTQLFSVGVSPKCPAFPV